jgi:hypothetical protein
MARRLKADAPRDLLDRGSHPRRMPRALSIEPSCLESLTRERWPLWRFKGERVVDVVNRLLRHHRAPKAHGSKASTLSMCLTNRPFATASPPPVAVFSDSGSEFIGRLMDMWA